MLTAIVYNCDPESLAEVDAAEFAEAFESEVRVRPSRRDLSVRVTFEPGRSGLTTITSDDPQDDLSYNEQIQEEFGNYAERAFRACCQ